MRVTRNIFVLLTVFIFLTFLSQNNTYALSCLMPNLDESVKNYEYIIRGKVKSKINKDNYRFEVSNYWKKETAKEIKLYKNSYWGDKFDLEKEYILFLTKKGETYNSGLCSLYFSNDVNINPNKEKSFESAIIKLNKLFGEKNVNRQFVFFRDMLNKIVDLFYISKK